MQYLLSAEEYERMLTAESVGRAAVRDDLQKLCTLVACHMPVKRHWESSDMRDRPWGCILVKEQHPIYCDQCPVTDLCPNQWKEFSK